jgi:hypothetical protein
MATIIAAPAAANPMMQDTISADIAPKTSTPAAEAMSLPTWLADKAAEINAVVATALDQSRSSVKGFRRAGELLLQVKSRCRHGEWSRWLVAMCPDISERSAQMYMKVARHCIDHPSRAAELETLPLRTALARIAQPSQRRRSTPPKRVSALLRAIHRFRKTRIPTAHCRNSMSLRAL